MIDLIKKYAVTIKGITPIRQHKRPEEEVPKFGGRKPTDEEALKLFNAHRYYEKGIGYYQPSSQVKKALVLAAHRISVPGEGRSKFSKYVSSSILIEPDLLKHKIQGKTNVRSIGHWTTNVSRGMQMQVWCVKPQIDKWELDFEITNLQPEVITDGYLKKFLEYAGMFCGLGADRPERGKNFGRFEVKSFKLLKTK